MRDNSNEQIVLMKDHMKNMIDHMQQDTLNDCFTVLTSQYEVLQQLYKIESMKSDIGILDKVTENTSVLDCEMVDDADCHEELDLPVMGADDNNAVDKQMYQVERKLKGAYVPEIEGYIPETILRNKDIAHGDYVYAEPIAPNKAGQKRFLYELAEKSQEEALADRIAYTG